MVRATGVAAGLVAAALGLAACGVAAPEPSADGPSAAASRQASSAAHAPSASTTAGPRLGTLTLDVERVNQAWTTPLLEFASDGNSIMFSSGVADGPDGQAAPDLWRYSPGAEGPEELWRSPRRDRSLVRIGGDGETWAFVEIPLDNTRAWDLWVLTQPGGEAVRLDTHPGDPEVSSLVPSFAVHEGRVAWTAFDRGTAGPVSQLLVAAGPDWTPRLIAERPAREAELWLPSMRGSFLAYCEVRYSADASTDERHVYLLDLGDLGAATVRLDTSGLATMPLLVDDGVIWKETEAGFSMFNWGRLNFHNLLSGETGPASMRPQEHVNYPSAGLRFVAAWGSDSRIFTIHDLDLGMSRYVARSDPTTGESYLRPHVAGDLLVWLAAEGTPEGEQAAGELRYAILPGAGSDR